MEDNTLSLTKRNALILLDAIREIVISEGNDEIIANALSKVFVPVKVGIVESDYMSYDDAIKELKISHNRNKLSQLAKEHGIKCHKFRNMPIGFHKDDIARLKEILSK